MGKPAYTEIERMGNSCNSRYGQKPRYFFLHTQEGDGTAESLAGYLNNPANNASYHYTVRNGTVVDVVDTDLASWSVGDANSYSINLCFAGSRASWSRAQWLQIEGDIAIAAWLAVQDAKKYGFSTRWLGSGGKYTSGNQGIADHQFVTSVIGWGSHTDVGPGFPGDVFQRYVAEYTGAAVANEGDDDMSWLDGTFTNFKKTTMNFRNLLWWLDKNTSEALDQFMGVGGRGWSILGKSKVDKSRDNTLVEAVAELREDVKKLLEDKDKA